MMRTNTMFDTPGYLVTWGSMLPSVKWCAQRLGFARPRNLRAVHPTIDDRRSVRERIPDR